MTMTRCCAWALASALALGPDAVADTVRSQYKSDGASAEIQTYGPESSVYLSVSQTQTKGPDGSAQAFLSFNAVSGAWPDDFVQVGGSGFIPATSVSANAERIQVDVEDVTLVPGFYLSGFRCIQQICESFTPTAAVPVHVKISKSRSYTVHSTGTRRLHAELVLPPGTTYDETQSGSVSYCEATAAGVVGDTVVPIENPVVAFASMSQSKGVIVSVTRSTP